MFFKTQCITKKSKFIVRFFELFKKNTEIHKVPHRKNKTILFKSTKFYRTKFLFHKPLTCLLRNVLIFVKINHKIKVYYAHRLPYWEINKTNANMPTPKCHSLSLFSPKLCSNLMWAFFTRERESNSQIFKWINVINKNLNYLFYPENFPLLQSNLNNSMDDKNSNEYFLFKF